MKMCRYYSMGVWLVVVVVWGMSIAMSAGCGGGAAGAGPDLGGGGIDAGTDVGSGTDVASDASTPVLPGGLIGWAAMPGLGRETTTGGLGGREVTATTAEELLAFAASAEPLIITIAGDLSVPRLEVLSNKTLIGAPGGVTISGGIRVRPTSSDGIVENVIIRNIRVNGATSEVEGDIGGDQDDDDAVVIYRAHHVWIDHCEIWDGRDGNLDIVHGSDFVTVSWSKFRYSATPVFEDHRFSNLVGHSDSANAATEDRGKLNVTFHHNWWAERVHERMPRVRFGQVHVFDNYYSSAGNNYAVRAGFEANVLVENNFFDGVGTPHEINEDVGGPAKVTARGNVYQMTTGAQDQTGTAFTPPYAYPLEVATALKGIVTAGAGPQ